MKKGRSRREMNKMTNHEAITLLLCALFGIAGFLVIIGSIGALERDLIGFGRCGMQTLLGSSWCLIAYLVARVREG